MKTRIILTAIAAGLACAPALHAQTPAKATGPWTKVPALTTACYQSGDPWLEKFRAAFDAVQQDHYKQDEINSEIQQQSTDTFSDDPMAVAQRMQQALMEDPQNAQKLMEMMQKSQQGQAEMPAKFEKENQLEAESKSLIKKYKAELSTALAPAEAREAALGKKVAATGFQGEGYPAWAVPEYHAMLRDRDAAYATLCGKWWAATGPIHAFMKRYKDFLVLERAAHLKELDEQKLVQFEAYGVDASRWRSTADYDAAEDYMNMAMTLFDQRENDRRCRPLPETYRCN